MFRRFYRTRRKRYEEKNTSLWKKAAIFQCYPYQYVKADAFMRSVFLRSRKRIGSLCAAPELKGVKRRRIRG